MNAVRKVCGLWECGYWDAMCTKRDRGIVFEVVREGLYDG